MQHIQDLVAQGANINYTYNDGDWNVPMSVINFAAESGDLESVKWLKSHGANPFTYEFFGDHEFYVKIKESGFSTQPGIKLIHSACNSGNIELVDWLLSNGTDISEVDLSDATASHNLPLVKWLVEEKGVEIDNEAAIAEGFCRVCK